MTTYCKIDYNLQKCFIDYMYRSFLSLLSQFIDSKIVVVVQHKCI